MQHVSAAGAIPAPAAPAAKHTAASVRATVGAYVGLMKPHVTVLLLGTTLAAMAVALRGMPPLGITLATMAGGALAAGSANAINCYWDRDIDQVMARTRRRALPAGKVAPVHGLFFGLAIGILSVATFAVFVNPLSAALALAAILFYVCIYTMWLKRRTPQNIVIGGAAGAVPVMIGWAAATGTLGLTPVLMFAVVFMWTPPHFWALSLVLKGDYARAGVPMLPVVRGERATRRQIVVYTVLLIATSLALAVNGAFGAIYLVSALLLGGGLLALTIRLARAPSLARARSVFWFSNYYLALLFAMMVVDAVLR
jgi:heme o synthase